MDHDYGSDELNEFDNNSLEFLGWFLQQPQTRLHDNLVVKDLREQGASRGVGKASTCNVPHLADMLSQSQA